MTNKELEMVICEALDAHKDTPFTRDAFVVLIKMAQALYPHTTYEHQIDVVARMKVLADPIDGLHPHWEPDDLFKACIKAIEAKDATWSISYEEAIIFINTVKMALKRLGITSGADNIAGLAAQL